MKCDTKGVVKKLPSSWRQEVPAKFWHMRHIPHDRNLHEQLPVSYRADVGETLLELGAKGLLHNHGGLPLRCLTL
jgi:hypothetical protein